MLIDFGNPHAWTEFNAELQSELALDRRTVGVQVYQSTRHALSELGLGLVRQFPQKTRIHYFAGLNPFVDEMAVVFAKAGLEIEALPVENAIQNIEKLDPRKDLLVLVPEDDPLTARQFSFEGVFEACQKKMITTLRLSHHDRSWLNSPSVGRFEMWVRALDSQLALALLGPRARPPALSVGHLPWPQFSKSFLQNQAVQPNRETVLELENSNPAGAQPFLARESSRHFDRAVLSWTDMDGASAIYYLAEELKIELKAPGQETRLETLSLARWGGFKTFDYLLAQGHTIQELRGTVIISVELITAGLRNSLDIVRAKILKLQNG